MLRRYEHKYFDQQRYAYIFWEARYAYIFWSAKYAHIFWCNFPFFPDMHIHISYVLCLISNMHAYFRIFKSYRLNPTRKSCIFAEVLQLKWTLTFITSPEYLRARLEHKDQQIKKKLKGRKTNDFLFQIFTVL